MSEVGMVMGRFPIWELVELVDDAVGIYLSCRPDASRL